MLARLVATTTFLALLPTIAGAETPFADHCEGNICYQRKVRLSCMKPEARRLLLEIAARFGKIEVASACDGRHAIRSAHYVGKAFDFRPYSAPRADVVAFLKASPHVGGVGTYSNGLIHADVSDRKMAWHGSGRGRVVWPIGAGTIVKSPDDPPAPVVVASGFSFFNLFQNPTGGGDGRIATAAVPTEMAEPVAAPIDPKASRLPPLPPRRPAGLVDDAAAPSVELASAEAPVAGATAFGDIRPTVMPAPVSNAAFMALAPTAPSSGEQAFALVAAPIAPARAERPAAAAPAPSGTAGKGFGFEDSLFSPRALAPPSQPGFSLARAAVP